MSHARGNILARLQRGRRKTVGDPVAGAAREIIKPVERFLQGLEKVAATCETVNSRTQIDQAVEQYLQQIEAGPELVVSAAVDQAALLQNHSLELQSAPIRGEEKNALTLAYAGIAETGSLVMLSSADTPSSSHFLPDNFICILRTRDILNDMETLWARMTDEQRLMPRSVNIITGPSRTADVEQTIQMGAHGPRRVHVILWNDSARDQNR